MATNIEPASNQPTAAASTGADDTIDLSPRDLPTSRRHTRNWLPILLIVGLLVIGGVVVTKFLTSAVDYYCNVDEVGTRAGCNADRRLRVQGVVQEDSVRTAGARTNFVIAFNGASLPVSYDGEPGGVFKACLPVVVHGYLNADSGVFQGDRLEVKHSENYVAANTDRIATAEQSTNECATEAADV